MSGQNPFRAEIEQILGAHTRTRYAKVFLGMTRGLSDDQMAEESVLAGEPVQPKRITWIRETVRMTLDDELATGTTRAKNHAGLYQELRNCPDVTGAVPARHHALDAASADRPEYQLGAAGARPPRRQPPAPRKPQQQCEKCFEVHAGECL